jgi:hypothetical protein
MATHVEVLAPPDQRLGPLAWLQQNLFAGVWNTLLTLVTGVVLAVSGHAATPSPPPPGPASSSSP